MKTLSILALPLAVSAAALDSRQLLGLFGGGAAPVAGVEKLTPQIKTTGTQRTLTKLGPYTLNGAKVSSSGGAMAGMGGMGMGGDSTLAGQSFLLNINKGFCNDNGPCTVYAGKVGVVFEDGTVADPSKGVYIHHVLTSDTSKKVQPFISVCNNPSKGATSISSLGSGTGFVGTGEDSADDPVLFTQRDGKSSAGFWVAKGDTFLATVELVNYNKEAKKVYITYDLEWAPGQVGSNSKGILISVEQCGTMIKTSNAGPTNTTSGKWTFMENGSILVGRGHLHDGGVQIDMSINDKYKCSSKATYGGEGATVEVNGQQWQTINSMSYCDGPFAVKKGDTLSYVIQYDLKRYPLRKSASGQEATGVMGMWSLTFAPTA